MFYFDHAASTPLKKEALETLTISMREDFANPSASHSLGKELWQRIEKVQTYFLDLLNAPKDDHFIFTSSATESNNTVIQGFSREGKKVAYFRGDHPSLVETVLSLGEGRAVSFCGDSISSLAQDKSIGLVVLSHVNNQSGQILDIEKISASLKAINPNLMIHVDAVQSFGKIAIDLKHWQIDSMSVAAHKMGGPKGIAGLYLKKEHGVFPLLRGGGQQAGFRSSTLAAPLIFSFAKAAEVSFQKKNEALEKVSHFSQELKSFFKNINSEIIFPFEKEECSPYILTFIVPGISSDILLRHLQEKDVYLSSSSACSSKIKGTNPTFSALGIEEKWHKNVLRFSMAQETTNEEIGQFIEIFKEIWDDLSLFVKRKK